MGLRSALLPAVLYLFGVFAAFMVLFGSEGFDVPTDRGLLLQYLLVGMAFAAMGLTC